MKGHTKKFCRKLKRLNKNKEETKEDGNENCLATVTPEDLVTILDEDMIIISCDESSWVVDTCRNSCDIKEGFFCFLYSC